MKDFLTNDIKISIVNHCEDNGETVSVERKVWCNDEVIYVDTMSPTVYHNCNDRISALVNWLSERTYPKSEQLNDVIEARREIIEEGCIHLRTLLNLKLKVLKARLYLVLLKLKNLLLGGVAP